MSDVFNKLTYYERRIIKLVVEGYTDRAIADKLKKSSTAISMAMNRIYAKLGVSNPTREKHPRILAALMYRQRYPEHA